MVLKIMDIVKKEDLNMNEKRKLVLVGTGFVGMSMAYSFLNTGGIDELVLIDVNHDKAVGEAMDFLMHVEK